MLWNEKDKRALKFGVVCAAAILLFTVGLQWYDHWGQVRKLLKAARGQMNSLSSSDARVQGLLEIVPVFEMPKEEDAQKFLFRQKLNEQLKKADVKGDPLKFLSITKSAVPGYGLLRIQLRRGKTKFGNALDLLATLKENPYMVRVEGFTMQCNPQNKGEVEIELTVSTFIKNAAVPESLGGL